MNNKKEKIYNAVSVFSKSNQNTEDYIDLAQVIQNITSQGNGLLWSEIRKVVDEALNGSDFKKIYPTYESYMVEVDRLLEDHCGLGHDHLIDYNWMDRYSDEFLATDAVYDYFDEYPAWG